MNKKLTSSLSLFAILSLLLLSLNCEKPKKVEEKKDLVGRITFVKGTVQLNGADASLGATVQEKDAVKTGKKSMAILQFGAGAIITLKANTKFKVATLNNEGEDGKPKIEILQKKGFTFNKIKSGYADYKVKSPTSVAGVRGTAFSLTVRKNGRTAIKLIEGKVQAAPVSKGGEVLESKAVDIEKGQKAEITAKGKTKVSKLKKKELTDLKSLNKVTFVPVAKLEAPVADEPIAEVPAEVQKAHGVKPDAPTGAKKKKKKLTIADLEKKYGGVSKIITKTGKTYIGSFEQKGKGMVIHTVNGDITINSADVQKVVKINN